MKRNMTIDIARGLAIISIILGHLSTYYIDKVVYTYNVPIFTIISGYFAKKQDIKTCVTKKARTLIVPYTVTCAVMTIIASVISIVSGESWITTAKEWLWASLYGSGGDLTVPARISAIGAIWFLPALFWASIFLQIAMRFKPFARFIFIIAMFLIGYYTAHHMFWFPASIQAGCCFTLYMYFGYCYRLAERNIQSLPNEVKIAGWGFAIIIWVSFIAHFESFWLVSCDFGQGIIDIIGSCCASACIVLIASHIEKHIPRLADILALCGRYSIVVLCVHITELKLIHWKRIAEWFAAKGVPWVISGGIAVVPKFLFVAGVTILLVRNSFTRNLLTGRSTGVK